MAVCLNGRGDGTGSFPRAVSVQCVRAGRWGRVGGRTTEREEEGEGEGEENFHASTPRRMYGGPLEWKRRRAWLFSPGCECSVWAGGRMGTWGRGSVRTTWIT
jgi:hypothetical protein